MEFSLSDRFGPKRDCTLLFVFKILRGGLALTSIVVSVIQLSCSISRHILFLQCPSTWSRQVTRVYHTTAILL